MCLWSASTCVHWWWKECVSIYTSIKSDPNDSLELRGGLGSQSLFLQETGDTKGAFVTGSAPQSPTRFQSPLLFDTVQSWREQAQDKQESKVLDREVNYKLSRETQFQWYFIWVTVHADVYWNMFHRQHTQAPADSSPPSPRAPSRLACFQLLPPSSLVQSATLLLYGASGTLLTYITPSLLSYNLLPQFLAAFPSSAWESPLLPDQDLTTNLRFLLLSHSQAWPWEAGQRDDLLRDPQYQYTPFSFSDSPLPALGGLYFSGRRSLLNQRWVKISSQPQIFLSLWFKVNHWGWSF